MAATSTILELLDRVYRTGETFTGSEIPVLVQRTRGDSLDQINDGNVARLGLAWYDDLETMRGHAEDLLKATAGQTGERIEKARARAEESLRTARTSMKVAGLQLDERGGLGLGVERIDEDDALRGLDGPGADPVGTDEVEVVEHLIGLRVPGGALGKRARAGDRRAFEVLVERETGAVYRACLAAQKQGLAEETIPLLESATRIHPNDREHVVGPAPSGKLEQIAADRGLDRGPGSSVVSRSVRSSRSRI